MIHPDEIYLVPTREQIANLRVGDAAIDAFGRMAGVAEITCRKEDIGGKLFVCYYTRTGNWGRMSMAMKEGEFVRTTALSRLHTSHDLDMIEREIKASHEVRS